MRAFFRRTTTTTGAVEVGWVIDPDQEAAFIWDVPHKLVRSDPKPAHAKSVSKCPAINDHESRFTEIKCPIDIHLRFGRDQRGAPTIVGVEGDMSSIRPQYLSKLLMPVNPTEWRHPGRPIIQIITPYLFVADEPAYLTMLPAFNHYSASPLPGLMLGGRFPIHVWPRELVWAFEWHDTAREIHIRRGDPWFYVCFETEDPSRNARLVEAEMTPALREYTKGISGVTNYVSRTFSLFDIAKQRRPKRLLKPKIR